MISTSGRIAPVQVFGKGMTGMMGPIEAVGRCFGRYTQFSGRASRAEFWWFFAFVAVGGLGCVVADTMILMQDPNLIHRMHKLDVWSLFSLWFYLLTLLPYMSAAVRRLHDGGFSGFWLLLYVASSLCAFGQMFFAALELMARNSSFIREMVPMDLATAQIVLGSMSAAFFLALFILLIWPSDPDDNYHGAPWRPSLAGRGKTVTVGMSTRDPLQGYAVLMANERVVSPEEKAARAEMRRQEVQKLYQERVLGRQSEA
jgi:uncharacterized membrane protein YhaH (DUF805 family)